MANQRMRILVIACSMQCMLRMMLADMQRLHTQPSQHLVWDTALLCFDFAGHLYLQTRRSHEIVSGPETICFGLAEQQVLLLPRHSSQLEQLAEGWRLLPATQTRCHVLLKVQTTAL